MSDDIKCISPAQTYHQLYPLTLWCILYGHQRWYSWNEISCPTIAMSFFLLLASLNLFPKLEILVLLLMRPTTFSPGPLLCAKFKSFLFFFYFLILMPLLLFCYITQVQVFITSNLYYWSNIIDLLFSAPIPVNIHKLPVSYLKPQWL